MEWPFGTTEDLVKKDRLAAEKSGKSIVANPTEDTNVPTSWNSVINNPIYKDLNDEGKAYIKKRYGQYITEFATWKARQENTLIQGQVVQPDKTMRPGETRSLASTPTPAQEAIDPNPWVGNPLELAASLMAGGTPSLIRGLAGTGTKILSTESLKAVGKLATQSVLGAAGNIPVDQITDIISGNHPWLSIPFNIIAGHYTGKALQLAVYNKVEKAFGAGKVVPSADQIDSVTKDVQTAVNAGKTDVADRMVGVVQNSEDFNSIWYKLQQMKLANGVGVLNYAKEQNMGGKALTNPEEMFNKVSMSPDKIPALNDIKELFTKPLEGNPKLKSVSEIVGTATKDGNKLKTSYQIVEEMLANEGLKPVDTTNVRLIGEPSIHGPINTGKEGVIPNTIIKPTGVLEGKPPLINEINAETDMRVQKMFADSGGSIPVGSAKLNLKTGLTEVDTTHAVSGEGKSTYVPPEKYSLQGSFGASQGSKQGKKVIITSGKAEAQKANIVEPTVESIPATMTPNSGDAAGLSRTELLSDGVVSREYNKIISAGNYNAAAYETADEWLSTGGVELYNTSQAGKRGDLEDIVAIIDNKRTGYISNENGAVSLPNTEKLNRIGTTFKELLIPFSTLPDPDKAKMSRYLEFGDIQRAEDYVNYITTRMNQFTDHANEEIFKFLDERIALQDIPAEGKLYTKKVGSSLAGVLRAEDTISETQVVANQLRQKFGILGREMLKRGMISQETYDTLNGRYVPYIMTKHIIGDNGVVVLAPGGMLNLSETLKRNPNLTWEQRRALGVIEDASKAVPIGMGKTLTDLAKFDYMHRIAEDPGLTWTPSRLKVDGYKRPIGIGILDEDVKTYAEMVKQLPGNQEVKNRYNYLNGILQDAKEATKNNTGDFMQLGNDPHFGDLAGLYIRTPTAKDLIPLVSLSSMSIDNPTLARFVHEAGFVEQEGMKMFKMTRVALSPVSWSHNVVSNILQNYLRGRSLFDIPGDMVKATGSILAKDDMYKEAKRFGLFRTNFVMADINDIYDNIRNVDPSIWGSFMSKMRGLSKYYGMIDDVAKFTIFHQIRRDGGSLSEAVLEAHKWGMDYSLGSRSVKQLSRHGVPFIAYQYHIIPLLAESLQRNPWKLPLLLAAPTLLHKYSQHTNKMTDEEWKGLERQIPGYIRDNNSYSILPYKTADNKWQWVSTDGFMPYGNWMNVVRGLIHKDTKPIIDMIGGPWIDLLATFKNVHGDSPPVDNYNGQPIYDRLDSARDKAIKTTEWLAAKWGPSFLDVRKGKTLDTTVNAISGKKDKWGSLITPAQAASKWLGLGLQSINPEQAMVIKKAKMNVLKQELYRKMNDQTIAPPDRIKYMQEYQKQVQQVLRD